MPISSSPPGARQAFELSGTWYFVNNTAQNRDFLVISTSRHICLRKDAQSCLHIRFPTWSKCATAEISCILRRSQFLHYGLSSRHLLERAIWCWTRSAAQDRRELLHCSRAAIFLVSNLTLNTIASLRIGWLGGSQ